MTVLVRECGPGTIVKLSPLGENQLPKLRGKKGEVVGFSRTSLCRRIKWDGIKDPQTLHRDLFDKV